MAQNGGHIIGGAGGSSGQRLQVIEELLFLLTGGQRHAGESVFKTKGGFQFVQLGLLDSQQLTVILLAEAEVVLPACHQPFLLAVNRKTE